MRRKGGVSLSRGMQKNGNDFGHLAKNMEMEYSDEHSVGKDLWKEGKERP